MREIDKAYYIREAELAVMLSMAGQKEIYGYPLHNVHDIGEADIHQMLFDMAGRGMLDAKDGKISISAEWQEIVDGIANAGALIVSTSTAGDIEQLFAYISDFAAVIRAQWQGNSVIRVEIWKNEDMPDMIMRHGLKPDSVLCGMVQTKKAKASDSIKIVEKKSDSLFRKPLDEVLREKSVLSVASCHDIKERKKQEQIIVCRQRLENYISVSNEEGSSAELYSDEKALELIENWIGRKQG